MKQSSTVIDKINAGLLGLAKQYAVNAETLAQEPYFREAILKISVNRVVDAKGKAN